MTRTTRRAEELRAARRHVDAEITRLRSRIREYFENANPVEALTTDREKLEDHAVEWSREQYERGLLTPAATAHGRALKLTAASIVLQYMEAETA